MDYVNSGTTRGTNVVGKQGCFESAFETANHPASFSEQLIDKLPGLLFRLRDQCFLQSPLFIVGS